MLHYFTDFANWSTYSLLNLEEGTKLASSVHFFIEDITKIFFLTFLIVFTMGFLKRNLSQEKVRDYLNGKPKWVGYILAIILGWITPFCSCSSIPLFVGFLKAGIPLSVAITFLAVSPMPIESIAILGSLIGFVPSMFYMLLCGIAGLVFGIMTEKFGWEKYTNKKLFEDKKNSHSSCGCENHNKEKKHCSCENHNHNKEEKHCSCKNHNHDKNEEKHCCCENHSHEENQEEKITIKDRLNDALFDVKHILGEIWLWILLGVFIGSFMHGYIPSEFFENIAKNYKFLSIPFSVIIGIPLYANHSSVIPIMQTMYMKGIPLGTILTFMMSITAISIPQIIIVKKILEKNLLIRFIIFLAISFMIIGLLFNLFM